MLKLSLLWTLCLFLAPLLWLQGRWVRRRLPVLPAASGPGCGGDGDFVVLGLGDSVISGVGLNVQDEALTAAVARQLELRLGSGVRWEIHGESGLTIDGLLAALPQVRMVRADLVLVSVGVNDVTAMTSVTRWQLAVTRLLGELKQRYRAPVVLVGLPPMERFERIPQPLRFALGVRAGLLDSCLAVADRVSDVYWLKVRNGQEPILAEDGYHPSAEACRQLALQISELIPKDRFKQPG